MNVRVPEPQFFSLDNRMTVVLFAGMGGGCDGLEDAGFHVHLAINHDPVAIAVHQARHPHTRHLRTDVFEVCPREATKGRGVRVLHASPDCTHFSVAKGGKPVSKRRRSLAWVVPRWAGQVRPEVITLENVPEIQTWGPLIAKRDPATGRVLKLDGTVAAKGERVPVQEQWLIPDPRHRGRIWKAWLKHMRDLGYNFEGRVLVCADYGVHTIRKRYFGVAKADGSPVVWRERTHAPRKLARKLKLKPWRGMHEKIDWSLPVKSIFGRKKPLADATLQRIARGVMRYVIEADRPFIVPITHSGGPDRAYSTDEALRTLTCAHRGEFALVAPHMTKFRTGATGADMREPLPTATANSFETRPGGAIPLGIVGATLVRTDQQSAADRNGVHDPGEPANTLHTAGSLAVVTAALAPLVTGAGGRAAQTEPRSVEEPSGATTTKEDRILVAATMVQTGYGERKGQAPRALDVREPAGTQMGGGSKAAVVAAFLAQHNNDRRRVGGVNPGREVSEPLSALTASGSQQGVIAASMLALRGTNADGRDIADPCATTCAGGNHSGVILAFLQHYFSSGKTDDDLAGPLGALTAKARHGLVTVNVRGEDYVITDIGIRMLEPEEGAAAHGFRPGSLPEFITIDGKTRRLTKTEKYHLVGNSVPPFMIQMLAEDNCRRELVTLEAAE